MNELSWKNNEGLRLFAAEWPVKHPKAVIAFVHGQSEHIGRYEHMARWFNHNGVAFVGYDQQGYGRSEGKRGHAKSLQVLLDDIGQLLKETRQRYPHTPLFLYGHSMGGNLVLNYVIRHDPVLAGLIVTGPWIRLAFEAPPLKVIAGKILHKLIPTLTLPTGLVARYLSHDDAVVKAYISDPLVHDQLSTAAGIALLNGADMLNKYSGVFSIPVLLMHGGSDKITSPKATREFAGRVAGEVTFHEWPGLYHEIHNEPQQEQVFEYTLAWMKRFIG
ncbi:MAG: lysophospholipase [Saprospiraceae bacterium]|nr:lysophospholipase [Saprospiraceae bacterium]